MDNNKNSCDPRYPASGTSVTLNTSSSEHPANAPKAFSDVTLGVSRSMRFTCLDCGFNSVKKFDHCPHCGSTDICLS